MLKVAIVWRGAAAQRGEPMPHDSRLFAVLRALEAQGFNVESAIYCEEASRDFHEQLLRCDGVLVWVDPLTDGRDRSDLDAILRDVAAAGVWVSAHPDTILKMGTKEVLYQTRHLGWGGDTALYRRFDDFRREFPAKLAAGGSRVLKQHRGNGGQGVWRVTLTGDHTVRLQEATHRDGTVSEMPLAGFLDRCEPYFNGDGRLIDQAFQPRIAEGMVRCYMSGNTLVGFARQYPAAGIAAGETFGLPAAKTMFNSEAPEFQALRTRLEHEWTPQMQQVLDLRDADLPSLWDADFLFGPRPENGEDSYVLCEINASCVTPFPPGAPAVIATTVARRLAAPRS
ncbi:MAG TPA: Cj0069 family protein [Steroidobacteraceae bacterium]